MSGSGTKRQAPEDPGPEEIQDTKKKISKLEETFFQTKYIIGGNIIMLWL